jgi:hypothetical protein
VVADLRAVRLMCRRPGYRRLLRRGPAPRSRLEKPLP